MHISTNNLKTVREFLEEHLKSHPGDVMDNNNRLVWIGDVEKLLTDNGITVEDIRQKAEQKQALYV